MVIEGHETTGVQQFEYVVLWGWRDGAENAFSPVSAVAMAAGRLTS